MKEKFLEKVLHYTNKTKVQIAFKCGLYFSVPRELSDEDTKWVVMELKRLVHYRAETIKSGSEMILLVGSI